MGRWYEVARLKNDTVETGSCVQNDYKLNTDNSFNSTITEYTNTGVNIIKGRMSPTSHPFTFNGSWTGRDGSLNGYLINIYKTDYNTYGVEYSCTNVAGGRNEFMYINFRTKDYSKERLEKILNTIKGSLDITPDLLDMTRKNCN